MFYIVDNEGTVHSESQNKNHLQAILDIMLGEEKYKDLELEIIDDTDED